MIDVQDWLAPLIGSLVLMLVPLIVAMMCNTVVKRMRANDLTAHEQRLDRKTLPSRKDDEKTRLKVQEQWNRIESYTRARNLCVLVAFAVADINIALIGLAVTIYYPLLAASLAVVLILAFVAVAWWAVKKPHRPIWATAPNYYRDLAMGDTTTPVKEHA